MRIVAITSAVVLAILSISPRQHADAAIDPHPAADAVATQALNLAIFDPAPPDFPAFAHFEPYSREFAAIAPLSGIAPSLSPLGNLPALKLLDLSPVDGAPEKAAAESDRSDKAEAKQETALAPDEMETPAPTGHPAPPKAYVLPAEPTVEVPTLPPRRPREADRVPAVPGLGRIVFAGFTLPPMGHTLFCLKYPADCRAQVTMPDAGPITLTDKRRAELVRINAAVNSAIKPMDVPGVITDKWLISPKSGDCNDYAVTKRHKLLALGWPSRDLLLAEVVTSWGVHHLVLVVRTDKGDLVADSLHKRIRNWADTPYRWVRVETPKNPKFWATIQTPEPRLVAMAGNNSQL